MTRPSSDPSPVTRLGAGGDRKKRGWLAPVSWSVAAVFAAAAALYSSATAREVAAESARTIFQIVTSPFVLEATLAILGLCIVIAINQRRIQKEGDGWVYLETHEPATDASEASDPPHRHDGVVWQEKPGAFDDAGTSLEVAEGYLDLGLGEDALRELESMPAAAREQEKAVGLRIRALVMTGQGTAAATAFTDWMRGHGGGGTFLAEAALASALWLHGNVPGAEAGTWLARARDADGAVVEKLPRQHPLRGFLVP